MNPNMKIGRPSVNPAGRPKRGLQAFKDRLAYWLETKTINDIQELVENPKKWGKLLSIDGLVVRRIAQALEKDGTGDFAVVMDRLLGKPAQAITGEDGAPLVPSQHDVLDIARRMAFLMSIAAEQPPILLEGQKVDS